MGPRAASRRALGERGAAAVEFALIVPVVLILIYAAISYAYMFSFRQALTQAAAEGARASVGGSDSATQCNEAGPFVATTCPTQYAASEAVRRSMDGYAMACGTNYLVCSITPPTTASCSSGHKCVSVTVSYPYRDRNLLPSIPGFGFVLPSNLSFTSTVVVR